MKIKIKDIENTTGKQIKKNFTSIGLDFATRAGVCTIRTDKTYMHFDTLFLEFKDTDKKQKYAFMVSSLEELIDDQDVAVVENVFVGFNRFGSLELAKYHGLALSACIRKNINYETPSAKVCRSKFKIEKQKKSHTWKKAVSDWVESNLGIDLKNDDDASDAVILALYGIIK